MFINPWFMIPLAFLYPALLLQVRPEETSEDMPMYVLIAIETILLFIWPEAMISVAIIYPFARPQKAPADTSNRINKIILLWFAMTRTYLFAKIPGYDINVRYGKALLIWDCYVHEDRLAPHFKFMRQDVMDYMKYDL